MRHLESRYPGHPCSSREEQSRGRAGRSPPAFGGPVRRDRLRRGQVRPRRLPPLALAALRFTVAGLLLCGLALLLEPASRPKKSDFVPMLGLGLVGFSLNQGSYIGGLSLTSGSNAALMVATAPVWGLLLGVALRLERARLRSVLGVVLALIGVGFVVREGPSSPGASLPGDLLVLVSALSLGAYTVLSLPLLRRYPPLSVAAYPMLIGGGGPRPAGLRGSREHGLGGGGREGLGGSRLLHGVGFRLRVRGLAARGVARGSEQDPRLPVPVHPHRRRFERPAPGRDPGSRQGSRRMHHPRRSLLVEAPLTVRRFHRGVQSPEALLEGVLGEPGPPTSPANLSPTRKPPNFLFLTLYLMFTINLNHKVIQYSK